MRRVCVVQPNKAACFSAFGIIGNDSLPQTLLERECGDQLQEAIAELPQGGFGIMAGTGAGKSAAIRRLALAVLGEELRIGVLTGDQRDNVNGNVLVMTPGVALSLIKHGKITGDDVIVIDEIHQTNEHLELFMALNDRQHGTVVWMSATVDPEVYVKYFESRRLIVCKAFDPSRKATVQLHQADHESYLAYGLTDLLRDMLQNIIDRQRGVLVFVPTRRMAEESARRLQDTPGLYADYYHGGLPTAKLQQLASSKTPRPFVIFMTPIGSSGLNLLGLTDVFILDQCYAEVIEGGYKHFVRRPLNNSELLQMAGRVNGRVADCEVHIVTTRDFDLHQLRPVAPHFVLGGSLERLALTSALLGIDVADLRIIGNLSKSAYAKVFERLVDRGLIIVTNGAIGLTAYGKQVEKLPADTAWAEVLLAAHKESDSLWAVAALAACVPELHKLVTDKWVQHRYADPNAVKGSDHLTAYNILAHLLRETANVAADRYKFNNKKLTDLCAENGYSEKSVQVAVTLFQTLCTAFGRGLPQPESLAKVSKDDKSHQAFIKLLATVQSMDFVYQPFDPRPEIFGNSSGFTKGECTIGVIKNWTDKNDIPRRSVEGTDIDHKVMEKFATSVVGTLYEVVGDQARALVTRQFMGKRLGDAERLVPLDTVPLKLLRPYMQKKAFANWQPPELQMPDITDPECVIPDVVTAEFGTDPWDDSAWVAYGVVRLNPSSRFHSYTAHWTLIADDAEYFQHHSICALPKVRSDAKLHAQEVQDEKARQQARPLLEELRRKQATLVELTQKQLPRDLAQIVRFISGLPTQSRAEAWFKQMATVMARIDAEIVAVQQQRQAEAGQVATLRPTAIALRDEVARLLDEKQDELPTSLYNELVSFETPDEALPARLAEIQQWIADATDTIKRASDSLATDLSALRAKFGR